VLFVLCAGPVFLIFSSEPIELNFDYLIAVNQATS